MKLFAIHVALLLCINDLAAIKKCSPVSDTTRYWVILTKTNGSIVKGEVTSYTTETITLLSGTMKETRKGITYFPETIPYYQIKTIKVKQWSLIMLIISAGLMFLLLCVIIVSPLELFTTNFGIVLLISPLLFIKSFLGLFKKKKFKLNGDRKKYEHFLSRLKKFG